MKARKNIIHIFLIFSVMLNLSSCTDLGQVKFDDIVEGLVINPDSPLVFAGVTSVSNVTDSTATINWTNHDGAASYLVTKIEAGTPVVIATVTAPATSANVTGLTPNTSYTFRVRLIDTNGFSDTNTNTETVLTESAPTAPTAIALVSPATSPGVDNTPTVRVSGVKSGDTIKLFRNNTCSLQVASGVATGSTIDLTSSVLTAATYNFYATATNALNTASSCSLATIAYTLTDCPSGFIAVPANSTLGVNSFCVMQFEAKNIGAIPTSQAASSPWVSLTQVDAKAACTASGYDLISNSEWLTIAQNAENVATNWSGAAVGSGMMARGHTDNNPGNALAVADTLDAYIGTGNNSGEASGSGWEQKRTLTLSNGNTIWDFAGNVSEWVDWSITAGLQAGPTSCEEGWTQLPSVACGALAAAEYLPAHTNYTSSYGIGQLYGGAGGGAIRGGRWDHGTYAGAFSLDLYNPSTYSISSLGFRCVYRPPE